MSKDVEVETIQVQLEQFVVAAALPVDEVLVGFNEYTQTIEAAFKSLMGCYPMEPQHRTLIHRMPATWFEHLKADLNKRYNWKLKVRKKKVSIPVTIELGEILPALPRDWDCFRGAHNVYRINDPIRRKKD